MQETLYVIIWTFVIYAFLGWCVEVAYAAVKTGTFVNRGFLNGPYCPIYGFGMLIVVSVLTDIKDNLFFLFVGTVLLTTVLEFLTGFFLEKLFHSRWWDYTDRKFNLKGYVCLEASLVWGVGGVILMKNIHPIIHRMILAIPHWIGVATLIGFGFLFAADSYITVLTVLKLNNYLRGIERVTTRLRKVSNRLGENIYENTTTVKEKTDEWREDIEEEWEEWKDNLEDFREDIEEWKDNFDDFKEGLEDNIEDLREELEERRAIYRERRREYNAALKEYRSLLNEKHKEFYRLLRAFPNMKSQQFNESLQKYKRQYKINEKKKEEKKDI